MNRRRRAAAVDLAMVEGSSLNIMICIEYERIICQFAGVAILYVRVKTGPE